MIVLRDVDPRQEATKKKFDQRQPDRASTAGGATTISDDRLGYALVMCADDHSVILRDVQEIVAQSGLGFAAQAAMLARLIAPALATPWAEWQGQRWVREYWRAFDFDSECWSKDRAQAVLDREVERADQMLAPGEPSGDPRVDALGAMWPASAVHHAVLDWAEREHLADVRRAEWLGAVVQAGVSGSQSRVAVVMAGLADRKGRVIIGQAQIGLDSSVSYASDAIKALAERGLLEVTRPGDWLNMVPGQ